MPRIVARAAGCCKVVTTLDALEKSGRSGSREADATEALQAEREALLARLSEVEEALG